MPPKILLPALLLLCAQPVLFAQKDNDNNVRISESRREFRFVKGNSANPVQVQEQSTRTYYCNSYRTEIPIVEFYSDVEKIDDVEILVDQSRKHGVTPRYEYYNSDGIFYSDARVCYFQLPLAKQATTSKVKFSKTILDPHYFTTIHFMESQQVNDGELRIVVPDWMQLELKELNFARYRITKTVEKKGGETIYTYRSVNLPALKRESSSPGISYYAPHIMVLNKYSETKDGRITFFNTLADQYKWYHSLVSSVENDKSQLAARAKEITTGLSGDEAKVRAIYQWVQDNIRYIAFEDGIAGFKPEKAQEVMNKKYGDCKGMANLMTELLSSLGIDARRCWIGTRHLAYDYSTPSLIVDNHMICVWMDKGKKVFLDGTEKYIGLGEVAERIQGRQVLIEDGDKFILDKVPVANYLQNTAYEKRTLSIEGSSVKGRITQNWKGENKEMLLSGLHAVKMDKQETALKSYLGDGKQNFEISGLKINNLLDYNKDASVEYDVNWKDVVTEFGEESYLEVDNRRSLENFRFDTTKRTLPYWFYFKDHLVFETDIKLPAGKKINELPGNLNIKQPGYFFKGEYKLNGPTLSYRCEIVLNQSEIRPEHFSQWNRDIDQLRNFYNQQIVLTKVK
ncbi:MAG: transglutaminase domain-containing protein [Chitinophagaceae bacterium]|nr:MAG: transglutaminase domain-containing protein [Chitinophagaceae bacterium]